MQKYTDVVTSARSGAAIPNARVTVKTYPAGATATIYSDDGVTTQDNPITTDANGAFSFYAADGRYSLTVSGTGITERTVTDILLADPDDADAEQSAADVSFTPSGSGTISRDMEDRELDIVSGLDFVPLALHDALRARTDSTDLAAYLQTAANDGRPIYWPHANYHWGTDLTHDGILNWFGPQGKVAIQGNSPQNTRVGAAFIWTGSNSGAPLTLDPTNGTQVSLWNLSFYVPKEFTAKVITVKGCPFTTEPERADFGIRNVAVYRTPLDAASASYSPGDSTSVALWFDLTASDQDYAAFGYEVQDFYAFNFNTLMKIDCTAAGNFFNGNHFANIKGYQVFRALDWTATATDTIANNDFFGLQIQPGQDSGGNWATGCIRFDGAVYANKFFGVTLHDITDANKLVVNNPVSDFINRFYGSNLPTDAAAVVDSELQAITSFPNTYVWSRNGVTKAKIDSTGFTFTPPTYTVTPELRFGGATTGITYSNRSGGATRSGNVVFWWFTFLLSSKGSATGSALVYGLPTVSGTQYGGAQTVEYYDTNLGASEVPFGFVGSGGADFVSLRKTAAGSNVAMTDADFANNTTFRMSGHYFV